MHCCGKEITSGRALWSRLTKSIKHLDCSLAYASQTSSNNGETVSVSQKQETSNHKRYKKTIVKTCFICGNGEPEEDEYDIYCRYKLYEIM